ncbi:hypothetical protein BGZ65_007150, partial [Modicella reniformis]
VDETGGGHPKQVDLGRVTPRASTKQESAQAEEDEDSEGWDEDVNGQDQLLQMGLRLMVLCRELCLKLEQLSVKTKKALRGVEDLIKTDRTTLELAPQGSLHHSSVTSSSTVEHGLSGSGSKATIQPPIASIALLQQSNLNSFRLLEILDIVKKLDLKEEQVMISSGLATDGKAILDRASIEFDLRLEPKANHLFLQSHQRAVHLTRLCQRFIFDSAYIPLVRPLADLALLPCWTEGQPSQGDDTKGARRIHQSTMGGTRTDVIKFRSSPSEYMEELMKQLQELPHMLGVYEGYMGLRFGVHLLPYDDQPLELAQQHQLDSSEQLSSILMAGTEVGSIGKSGVDEKGLGVGEASPIDHGAEKDEAQQQTSPEDQMAEMDDLGVINLWIASLSRAAMHTIVERLYNPHWGQTKEFQGTSTGAPPSTNRSRFGMGSSLSPASVSSPGGQVGTGHGSKERHYLTRLSDAGAKQLELDLEYLDNAYLMPFLIEPTPSIRALIKALRLSEAGLLMALQQMLQHKDELQQHLTEESSTKVKYSSSVTGTRSSFEQNPQQVSLLIPGAPVMPSGLVVAEEDFAGQLEVEQKVMEWVAGLKGIDIPNL